MANDPKAPSPGAPKMYVLENRTRSVYRFVFHRTVSRGEGRPSQLVFDHSKDLVLGDQADKVLPPGIERNPRCPDPVARISEAQLESMSPANRKFLDSLIADSSVEMRLA